MKKKVEKPSRRKRAPARNALVTISVLLICSAIVRVGDDAGQAFARAPADFEENELVANSSQEICTNPEGFEPLLVAIRQREERLKFQELASRDRMQALKIADIEIERKLAALKQAEDDLRSTIALADTAAENDIDRLTRVYESMKPKQAAALFEEMNPNFAAGFLGRMRPEAAAGIMAGLSPEAAHTFSVVMAGRNANVPTE